MSVLVTGLEIQRFAGPAFLVGVLLGCQRAEPDVAAMIEEVSTAGSEPQPTVQIGFTGSPF